MPPPGAPPRSDVLRQIAAYGAILGGVLLLGMTASALFGKQRPAPALVGVLVLGGFVQIAVAIGLLRRQRVAWAFGLSLYIVGTIVALLALPAMIRSGMHPILAVLALLYAAAMIVMFANTDSG